MTLQNLSEGTGDSFCAPGDACFGGGHGSVSLWDQSTGGIVGTYRSQDEAIDQVASWLQEGEDAFVDGLVLLRVKDGGCAQRPIRGHELRLIIEARAIAP